MPADRFISRFGLRLRIATLASIAVAGALAVGAVGLTAMLRTRLENAAEATAEARAVDVAALARDGALPVELSLPGDDGAVVQVVDGTGKVISQTRSADVDPLAPDAQGRGGHDPRVQTATAVMPNGMTITVYAAENDKSIGETVDNVGLGLALGLPAIAVLVGALAWWAVGRSLRGVRSISATMAEITATDLHRRVDVPASRDEIRHLAVTVNDTLQRLDYSTERQRRFVADASHELRGPLASLRADLEISLAHPDITEWRNVATDTLGDVERLQHLAEHLLELARLDATTNGPEQQTDLRDAIANALDSLPATPIEIGYTPADEPVEVGIAPRDLDQIVNNLLSNAIRHAANKVELHATATTTGARLEVLDDGHGIPEVDRQRIFERFVRLDDARTRDTGGTGLGLAIVHDIVTAHHGTILVTGNTPNGTHITVDLPHSAGHAHFDYAISAR